MRFAAYVELEGDGAIARLARVTGLSYKCVHELAWDKHPASPKSAVLLSKATHGRVTVAELLWIPAKPETVQKRKRRARDSRAAAHG